MKMIDLKLIDQSLRKVLYFRNKFSFLHAARIEIE